eukprot:gene10620-11768_t
MRVWPLGNLFGDNLLQASKPQRFQISLERDLYFPGETIKGQIDILCSIPIKCRGVRIHLQGKGSCYFETGSGDNRQSHSHKQFYSNCKRTVFGNVHKTAVIRDAGSNAIFGPPWAPDEGLLSMGLPPGSDHVILRVMDYDWCKKDDLLGEVLVRVADHVGKESVELRLFRKGQQLQSSLVFRLDYDDSLQPRDVHGQPLRGLRIQLQKALNLRSADWFSKNDVYVQAYAVPVGEMVSTSKALPEPVNEIELPAGHFSIPFSFQLPRDLPSSMVSLSGDDYIAYSVYAYIDIAWKADPSTRRFFTVMQHQAPGLYVTPREQVDRHVEFYQHVLCCPLVCLGPLGRLATKLSLPRSAYAPGEQVCLRVEISSEWQELSVHWRSLSVTFQQVVSCWADGRTFTYRRPLQMPAVVFNNGSGGGMGSGMLVQEIVSQVPVVPPSYAGGLGRDSTWLGEVSRYGGVWSRKTFDPIVWGYELCVELIVRVPGLLDCEGTRRFSYMIPLSVTTVPKAVYDYMQRGGDIFSAFGSSTTLTALPPLIRSLPPVPHAALLSSDRLAGQHSRPVVLPSSDVIPHSPGHPMEGYAIPASPMTISTVLPVNTPYTPFQPSDRYEFGQVIGIAELSERDGEVRPTSLVNESSDRLAGIAELSRSLGLPISTREGSVAVEGGDDSEYFHAPEINPAFQGLQMVPSNTKKVIRDPEEDFTVESELELMYCPLYFKSG